MIHAWNGVVVLALTGLGWAQKLAEPGAARAALTDLHVTLGTALAAGLVARGVWGVIGPGPARLRGLWHPRVWLAVLRGLWQPSAWLAVLRGLWHPRAWLPALRSRPSRAALRDLPPASLTPSRDLPPASLSAPGHDPVASGAYVLFYALLLVLTGTGLALAGLAHDRGPLAAALFDTVALQPWLARPHDLGLYGVTAFVVVHLLALARHERRHGHPVAQSMVSGYQYHPLPHEEPPHA